ncbi:MAG TPA: VWA domain-containing protein [Vicinamibacterales bacterium]|jgi:VWFA-related protein|nr:VWA domain-containing protein [Vicinamibacterales bacterium]
MRNTAKFLLAGAFALAMVQVPAAQQQANGAQQQGQQRQGQNQAQQQQQQQTPTFRSTAELVTTDVIVRDSKNDQFIADLKPTDFDVFEDGVKQDLASMVLIHGGRAYNTLAPPPAPTQEGILLPIARPTNDAAGRVFLLFVDDLHMDFQQTPRIREIFRKMLKNLIHDGDMWGMVSTGTSSISIDLTYDRALLDDAINRISGNGLKPTEIIKGQEGADGPVELRYRAHVAFTTANQLMSNLEKLHNRRKAVIWVSSGYDFNPFEKSRLKEQLGPCDDSSSDGSNNQSNCVSANGRVDPNITPQGSQFADAELVRDMADVTRAANRANATLYTIDPRGLVAGGDIGENVDPVEWETYVSKTVDSLRTIADLTGGFAVVNQNDFDKALKRIDAETSDYYVLGFYSSNPDPLRRTRRIEVVTKRDGVKVWSRTSYSLRPTPADNTAKK